MHRSVRAATNQIADDSDELGDVEGSFDAADLEEVAARYDAHYNGMPKASKKANTLSTSGRHSGDAGSLPTRNIPVPLPGSSPE